MGESTQPCIGIRKYNGAVNIIVWGPKNGLGKLSDVDQVKMNELAHLHATSFSARIKCAARSI